MKDEIIIDGIKYKKVIEENNYPIIKWSNYEWYVIDKRENEIDIFMKDVLSDENLKKYFDEDMIDKTDNTVIFNKEGSNQWKDSPIRFILNTKFLRSLNKENIIYKNDDYIRLINKDECDKLPLEIRIASKTYWSKTPWFIRGGDSGSSTSAGLFTFGSWSGDTYDGISARVGFAVRPVVTIKSEVLEDERKY